MKVDSEVLKKLDRVQLKFLLGSMKGVPVDRIKGQSTQTLRLLVKDALQSNIDNNQEVFVHPASNAQKALRFLKLLFGTAAVGAASHATFLSKIGTAYMDEDTTVIANNALALWGMTLALLGLYEATAVFSKAYGKSTEETIKIVTTLMRTAGTDLTSRPEFTQTSYATYKKDHSAPCKRLTDEEACGAQPACEWRDRRCRASRATKLKYKPANPRWDDPPRRSAASESGS
jgi:hypothetical protein